MDTDLFLFDMFILLITDGYDLQQHETINLCKEKQIILTILNTWQFLTVYSLGSHTVNFKRKPKVIPHGKTTNYYELSIVHCSGT